MLQAPYTNVSSSNPAKHCELVATSIPMDGKLRHQKDMQLPRSPSQ